jgi:hypothetical protein
LYSCHLVLLPLSSMLSRFACCRKLEGQQQQQQPQGKGGKQQQQQANGSGLAFSKLVTEPGGC